MIIWGQNHSGLNHKCWIYPPHLRILLKCISGVAESLPISKFSSSDHGVCTFLGYFCALNVIIYLFIYSYLYCMYMHVTLHYSAGHCMWKQFDIISGSDESWSHLTHNSILKEKRWSNMRPSGSLYHYDISILSIQRSACLMVLTDTCKNVVLLEIEPGPFFDSRILRLRGYRTWEFITLHAMLQQDL